MPSSRKGLCALLGFISFGLATPAAVFAPVGSEYPGAGMLPGDQLAPSISLDSSSGLAVWQDHGVDNSWTIRGRRLTSSGTGLFSAFTISSSTNDDQTSPKVAYLKNGNSAVIWVGGTGPNAAIYARLLKPGLSNPAFLSAPFAVSQKNGNVPSGPSIASLDDGTFVVTWASDQADGSQYGVLAQHLGPNGEILGTNFVANQSVFSNQRNPVVAALPSSSYVIGWISENQRFDKSVDLMARVFAADGTAKSDELRLNFGTNICSSPVLAGTPGGGFLASWVQRDPGVPRSPWSVYTRSFDTLGNSPTPAVAIAADALRIANSPRLAVSGNDVMLTWQSLGAVPTDSRAYAAFLALDGTQRTDAIQLSSVPLITESAASIATAANGDFITAWTGFKSAVLGTDINFRKFSPLASGNTFPQSTTSVASWNKGKVTLKWATTPNGVYQIQTSTNLKSWTVTGSTRTATGTSDSIDIAPDSVIRFFQVSRIQ